MVEPQRQLELCKLYGIVRMNIDNSVQHSIPYRLYYILSSVCKCRLSVTYLLWLGLVGGQRSYNWMGLC